MKELECSQDFSHYKSMGIFPDAQGQLKGNSVANLRKTKIYNTNVDLVTDINVYTKFRLNLSIRSKDIE